MKSIRRLLLVAFLLIACLAPAAFAGTSAPLFVNLTTADAHRATMGIGFAKNQFGLGHPVTLFLNDKGVLIGSRAHAGTYAEHQKMLGEVVAKGGTVLICPTCMKHYGVTEADLLPGLKVSSPEVTGKALFADGVRTLTW